MSMANTLLSRMMPGMNNIMGMMQMMKNASNPMAAMQQMMGNNPQMQQVMQVVQQHGGDAKGAFYAMAQQQGVNPDEILSQVRQMMG